MVKKLDSTLVLSKEILNNLIKNYDKCRWWEIIKKYTITKEQAEILFENLFEEIRLNNKKIWEIHETTKKQIYTITCAQELLFQVLRYYQECRWWEIIKKYTIIKEHIPIVISMIVSEISVVNMEIEKINKKNNKSKLFNNYLNKYEKENSRLRIFRENTKKLETMDRQSVLCQLRNYTA